jgi:hypothetical protein
MSEITTFEGDMFWDSDDTESCVDDPEEFMDEVGFGTVICFDVAKRLPGMYGVQVKSTEPGGRITKFFSTLKEAETWRDAQ